MIDATSGHSGHLYRYTAHSERLDFPLSLSPLAAPRTYRRWLQQHFYWLPQR